MRGRGKNIYTGKKMRKSVNPGGKKKKE